MCGMNDAKEINRRLIWTPVAAFLLGAGLALSWLRFAQPLAPAILLAAAFAIAWSQTGSKRKTLGAVLPILVVIPLAFVAAAILR
jgi:1,4-dihydroxy-2-naphthoate octaprenyltransferase